MAERGVNKVILIGRLGAEPEIRFMQDNTKVATFNLGTSKNWKDKNTNQQQSHTEWHRCAAFKRTAELIGEWLGKGDKIYIEGHLRTRKWRHQDGTDRYTTEIIIDELQFLDIKRTKQQPEQQPPAQYAPPQQGEPPQDFDDDIPFAPIGKQYRNLLNCM